MEAEHERDEERKRWEKEENRRRKDPLSHNFPNQGPELVNEHNVIQGENKYTS